MMRRKMNALGALAFTAGMVLVGVRLSAFQPPPPAKNDPPRLDAYGEPLPPGAIARLGTERLRQGFMTYSAVFSPDGKTVASTSAGQGICLWEAATGKRILQVLPAVHSYSVAFLPDGQLFATSGRGLRLWETATGRAGRALTGDKGGGTKVVGFGPN